jgi:hypothetical protein
VRADYQPLLDSSPICSAHSWFCCTCARVRVPVLVMTILVAQKVREHLLRICQSCHRLAEHLGHASLVRGAIMSCHRVLAPRAWTAHRTASTSSKAL